MVIELSNREVNIMNKLLDNRECAIKIKDLASYFEVSIRTIKYDLDNIREWLKQHQVKLESRRNFGVWIDVSGNDITNLKNRLHNASRQGIANDLKKRLDLIMMSLISAQNYMTSQELADRMKVSKNTIINDLDKIEDLLQSYQLSLIRKNRLGFSLKGDESHLRYLFEHLIQKNISDFHIFKIMKGLTDETNIDSEGISLGINEHFEKVFDSVLKETQELISYTPIESLNFNEILSFILRTSISVHQLKKEQTIHSYQLLTSIDEKTYTDDISFKLMSIVYEKYNLPLFRDEFNYIKSDLTEIDKDEQEDLVQLTNQIIDSMSKKAKFPYDHDRNLFNNLFAHLSLRFNKEHLFINEYNPFTEDIKKRNRYLFENLEEACKNIIGHKDFFITESFVAYLALHFLVSKETSVHEQHVVRVLYVCSTGLGITNLIQQVVKEEIENIEIEEFVSILEAKELIQEKQPDLVISIFPLEGIEIPFIQVSPIPDKNDIEKIKEQIDLIFRDPRRQSSLTFRQKKEKNIQNKESIRDLIIDAVLVYQKLLNRFDHSIKKDYKEAFQLHVMLLVYRINYDEQYDNEIEFKSSILMNEKKTIHTIEEIFSECNLGINTSEIIALLQYIQGVDNEHSR